ncbi:MAG: RNA polymerase-associated protein RapA, partial [Gammaproteobacteria bacterium]|nr:RNA polymerase-associated protein RapA [Gammaproteobacteria bacterium]
MEYVAGQRWVSESEPNLGLGIIISADNRMVEVLFHSKEITRSYAKQNAPLTRVSYDEGDEISHVNGETYLVSNVENNDGILYYTAAPLYAKEYPTDEQIALNTIIAEIDLDHRLQFNSPESRLFCGQIDKNKWFDLRYHTLKLHAALAASGCKGFLGSRVSLIPHQFHIAEEVSLRHSPRVLLADEVGLGKTIEAGLILHQQLVTGIAQRALIIVPENLLHQWLVEMARRFNLMFSLFDAERCREHGDENPFESEQLVICGLNFLVENKQRREQITSCDWDVLVVDEAHHIEWMPEQPSEAYNLVEQLANIAPSVLLLTATPEQLGPEGHFARLRLLDPYRFHNLESFLAEEENYVPVAKCALKILSNTPLDDSQTQLLTSLIGAAPTEAYQQAASSQSDQLETLSQDILSTLIDQHGTGRVLFRNTRKSIKGFTQRKLHPLPCPSAYSPLIGDINHLEESLAEQIYPERFYQENKNLQDKDWWLIDARFQCLLQVLKQNPDKKIILICAHQDTVLDIEQGLRVDHGIYAAVFHEGLNIIERDRSAAYFADKDDDCQLLICSEIGSEGRNFQFAHHLFLFDMPLNADLLEQRIGR